MDLLAVGMLLKVTMHKRVACHRQILRRLVARVLGVHRSIRQMAGVHRSIRQMVGTGLRAHQGELLLRQHRSDLVLQGLIDVQATLTHSNIIANHEFFVS